MPSNRRVRTFSLGILLTVTLILWYTSDARHARDQTFYQNTVNAMDSKRASMHEQSDREIMTQERLMDEARNKKAPSDDTDSRGRKESYDAGITFPTEKSVAGRKKMPVGPPKEERLTEEELQQREVEDEMNSILKRGPIIIFSKSYCPYSARAKSILLDKYLIEPRPYVVELDQHEMGPQLQALLANDTRRKTVPNILINGRSIGGGDETKALDESGNLPEQVRNLGGKRILEARLRSPSGS